MQPRLSPEEFDLIAALARPIAQKRHAEFFRIVAEILAQNGATGPGAAYRAAREAQPAFVANLRTEATVNAGREARHLAPRRSKADGMSV